MAQKNAGMDDDVKRERTIPVEIAEDPFYSESNMRFLAEKMAEYKKGTLKTSEHSLHDDNE